MKFSDYVGQKVNARYAVERNVDGADVPVTREGQPLASTLRDLYFWSQSSTTTYTLSMIILSYLKTPI